MDLLRGRRLTLHFENRVADIFYLARILGEPALETFIASTNRSKDLIEIESQIPQNLHGTDRLMEKIRLLQSAGLFGDISCQVIYATDENGLKQGYFIAKNTGNVLVAEGRYDDDQINGVVKYTGEDADAAQRSGSLIDHLYWPEIQTNTQYVEYKNGKMGDRALFWNETPLLFFDKKANQWIRIERDPDKGPQKKIKKEIQLADILNRYERLALRLSFAQEHQCAHDNLTNWIDGGTTKVGSDQTEHEPVDYKGPGKPRKRVVNQQPAKPGRPKKPKKVSYSPPEISRKR